MPWLPLGTVTPNPSTWQSLPIPVLLGELFRVRHDWVGDWPGSGYVQIGAVYADGGRYGFSKSWPDRDPKMLIMPIPQHLIDAGFIVRYLAIRRAAYGRTFAAANWQVSIDIWTDSSDPSDNPIQLLDGGTY